MPASTLEGPPAELADDHDPDRLWRWGVRILYTGLIAAELWVLFDWWRDTPGGRLALERWARQLERARKAAQECEGCAKRKAMLRAAINRMHWQAQQIVEGADVPTEGEAPSE